LVLVVIVSIVIAKVAILVMDIRRVDLLMTVILRDVIRIVKVVIKRGVTILITVITRNRR
jgi:hypothetical protein